MGELRQSCPNCVGRAAIAGRDRDRLARKADDLRADARQARMDAAGERAMASGAGGHNHGRGCSVAIHLREAVRFAAEADEMNIRALEAEAAVARVVIGPSGGPDPRCVLCAGSGFIRGNGSAEIGGEGARRGDVRVTPSGVRIA